MYKLLIKKLKRDNLYTERVIQQRSEKIVEFWAKEGDKYIQLVNRLNNGDKSFDDLLLNFGYWFRFKLLCEGQEPTLENVIADGFDFYALKLFVAGINSLEDD